MGQKLYIIKLIGISICLLGAYGTVAQIKDEMLIGRTTGAFQLPNSDTVRVFGFTNTLSGQVMLPGITLNTEVGDSIRINFWNVSQGDPHDFAIAGIEIKKSNQRRSSESEGSIHHMEHGFYRFTPDHAGTYIYSCPVNYPFNIQAGMFGILIVRPKNNMSETAAKPQEHLWCGFEIDTTWHNDALMDVEYEALEKPPTLDAWPTFSPQYFYLSNVTENKREEVLSISNELNTNTIVRIVNTGLRVHKVTFPKRIEVKVISKNAQPYIASERSNQFILQPMQSMRISLHMRIESMGTRQC